MNSPLHSQFLSCHLISAISDCRLSQFYAATANSGTRLISVSSCVISSLYSLGEGSQKTPLPLLLPVDSVPQDVFTAQLRSNERGAEPQRTPLVTFLLLLRDVTAYVTRDATAVSLPPQFLLWANTPQHIYKYVCECVYIYTRTQTHILIKRERESEDRWSRPWEIHVPIVTKCFVIVIMIVILTVNVILWLIWKSEC
jgi:hypothetical protein